MTNITGQVAGGIISNGQGCYGAFLLPDTFKKILLTLAENRCVVTANVSNLPLRMLKQHQCDCQCHTTNQFCDHDHI